ncbi:sugar ABC transporter permease [Microbacterium sp. KSW4-11]|uniref:Sugar ABC transporter permease n=2 Tax=Microbacterium TaxID=33882 RepID=A0A177K9U9_9MICO|nr:MULTISPECIES: sugar ABC transporter permease [Microbacterium]MDT3316496.1 sugar ABC transporter permease [Microbacterium sp. KSW4-11]OAH50180.1 sugar ABC transporter permease [Microbacterium oleivorans]
MTATITPDASAPTAGAPGAPSRRRKRTFGRYRMAPFLFTVITAALFALFFLWPGVLGLSYSLTDFRGWGDANFVGLDNYRELLSDPSFYAALGRTFVFALFSVPLSYALSLGMAVAINATHARGKTAARIIFFLPWLVSPIVTGVIWRWMFGESFGFVNFMISVFGGDRVPWSSNADLSLLVVIVASSWGGAAFNMLLFVAALNNVPKSYYEAAELDGANGWQRFRSITLPSIAPTSILVILLSTLGHMKEFALIQSLNGGGPGTQNRLIVQYIYETGFKQSEIGYASAASMILLVILMVIAIVQLRISRRSNNSW